MGSPITFSGFNSIDFNMILNAVMAQERAPLTRLEAQKKTLETQDAAFGTLAGKLATLGTAVEDLQGTDSLALLSATSSGDGVGVSAATGTIPGTYEVVVSQLALAQVTSSTTTYSSLTEVVATSGTLTLTATGGTPVTITLSASTTLEELADAINAEADSPATAAVVQTAPGTYRLVLTGADTGADNAFTISHTLAGGTGLTFTDTDSDGVSGDSAADNARSAVDASFTVNNLSVTSASNSVTDVVPGVTLSLNKADPATTVTISVTRDIDAAKALVQKAVDAYNGIVAFAKDQNTAAVAGKASIGRDPLMRSVREALRQTIMAEYVVGGTFSRLAEIGVGFTIDGKMTLDGDVFDTAMAASAGDVQLLVSGGDGTGGAFGALATVLDDYTQVDGLVPAVRERIDDQVSTISRRLDTLESQLALRRLSLQREQIAADLAMTRLKAQGASLQSIGGGYRLF
jgi:flagellar hook-associated protein 2